MTGDAVRLTTPSGGGQARVDVLPTHRHDLAATVTRVGGHVYVVPAAAARYVGRSLDLDLFDVSAAARADAQARRATEVTVDVAPGRRPAVPGLTVTSRSGDTWHGRLDAAGARAFGAALAAQTRTDARHHRTGATLFGGVTHVAAAGVRVSRPVTPAFPQRTLTITAQAPDGKPVDDALVVLTNVDDSRKFNSPVEVVDGVAKVSVPTGHYAGQLNYYVPDGDGYAAYLVPVEGITVTDDGGTATFDTRTATTVPDVTTPRPSAAGSLILEWDRDTAHGGADLATFLDTDHPIHVAPTPRVRFGTLNWTTSWSLSGAPSSGLPYTYDLSYRDTGRVPADQRHVVRSAQLARVDARYYTDGPNRYQSVFGRAAEYPGNGGYASVLSPFGVPAVRTEYVSAPAGVLWHDSLIAAPSDLDPFQGSVDDGPRAYPAGSARSADWLRGPLGPGFVQPTRDDRDFLCGYCRDAASMLIGLDPVTDTVTTHAGSFDLLDDKTVAARYRLYRDGTLIDDQKNATSDQVAVPAASATYRAVVQTARGLVGFRSSTTASTDVTFVSAAGSGPVAPARWGCPDDPPCTVLPVLTTTVPLPTDLAGTMRQGSVPMVIRVGHVAGAADPALKAVSVQLTHDGGSTWTRVPVTLRDAHHFLVTLQNPASAAGRLIGLRLVAKDAAGGRLVQIVQAAYRVAR